MPPIAPGREKTCPQVGGPRRMPGAVLGLAGSWNGPALQPHRSRERSRDMERERARLLIRNQQREQRRSRPPRAAGFVASWRSINLNRTAIRIGGSPFKAFAEAERACEAMLVNL